MQETEEFAIGAAKVGRRQNAAVGIKDHVGMGRSNNKCSMGGFHNIPLTLVHDHAKQETMKQNTSHTNHSRNLYISLAQCCFLLYRPLQKTDSFPSGGKLSISGNHNWPSTGGAPQHS